MLPYLRKISAQRRVNPREVKRFVNAYILQTLIRPKLLAEVILALQTLAFRRDWAAAYELANSRPDDFIKALKRHRADTAKAFDGLLLETDFTSDLADFLHGPLAKRLAERDSGDSLDPYLSSVQSTRIPDLGFGELAVQLNGFDLTIATTPDEANLDAVVRSVADLRRGISGYPPDRAIGRLLRGFAERLKQAELDLPPAVLRHDDKAIRSILEDLRSISREIRVMRDATGPY